MGVKQLYEHQTRAISLLRQSLGRGQKRVMMQAPTGSGKTVIASSIVRMAREKGNRAIFVVPSVSLVDQTVARFYEDGITEVGVIQAQHEMTDYAQPVQVASIQTLMRRRIPDSELVIIDEAHRMFDFYHTWFELWNNVPFVGLSATPWTRGLGKLYDELVIAATTQELIDKGFLSPFKVYAPSHPDLTGVKTVAGDYHEGQLADAMDKAPLVADIVSTWKRHAEGMPTFCYGVNRAHAQHIQREFMDSGVPAGYMDSYTDRDERTKQLEQFRRGELKIICNCEVLTTGIDEDVRCLIMARPTKSEMLFTQIVGRALRTAPGKDHALILDHSDTHLRLGFVTDIHHDELDDGKPKDKSEQERKEPLPKECGSCHFLKPPKTHACPACGFAPEKQPGVEHVDGELQELNGKATAAQKRNRKWSKADKAAWLGQLKGYAYQKGYKPGWIAHKYREYFSVWPNKIDSPPLDPGPEVLSWIRSQNIRKAKAEEKRRFVA